MQSALRPCGGQWGSPEGHDCLLSAHHGRHDTTRQEAVLGPGSHVHDRRPAQQHPQPMRPCRLNRHPGAHHRSFPAVYGGELRRTKRPRSPRAFPVSPTRRQGWTPWSTDATLPRRLRPGFSGFVTDGLVTVFRFAACRFGQKTAGSPLRGSVALFVRWFASSLAYGMRYTSQRGSTTSTVRAACSPVSPSKIP